MLIKERQLFNSKCANSENVLIVNSEEYNECVLSKPVKVPLAGENLPISKLTILFCLRKYPLFINFKITLRDCPM